MSLRSPSTFCSSVNIWLKPLVLSFVDANMVSTRRKKPKKKKLLSQLTESDADLMTGQNNHEVQVEGGANRADRNNTKDPNEINSS